MNIDKNNTYEGFSAILKHFEVIKRESPKGITITRKNNKLYLQFKTPHRARSPHAINENFTIHRLNRALEKAIAVAQKLSNYESESEFWQWYEEKIKGINNNTINDVISIKKAIETVKKEFFSRKDKRGLKRSIDCQSDQDSYYRENGFYFQKLPQKQNITYQVLYDILFSYCDNKYQRKFQDCLRAFIRLCELNCLDSIAKKLSKFKVSKDKQNSDQEIQIQSPMTIKEFLYFRDCLLNIKDKYQNDRKFWLLIYSLQTIYGLRIGELLSAKNLDSDYRLSDELNNNKNDHTLFKAISNIENKSNYLVITDFSFNNDKTAKTGYKICIPMIPPDYPNLFDVLKIKQYIPIFIDRLKQYEKRKHFTCYARQNLEKWSIKFLGRKISQTHTNRRLGNANGIAMGLPDSLRAKTLGHSIDVNYRYYQNFDSQLIIDLFESSKKHKQPIPFQLAVKLVEQKLQNISQDETDKIKPLMWELLKDIYQVDLPDYFF